MHIQVITGSTAQAFSNFETVRGSNKATPFIKPTVRQRNTLYSWNAKNVLVVVVLWWSKKTFCKFLFQTVCSFFTQNVIRSAGKRIACSQLEVNRWRRELYLASILVRTQGDVGDASPHQIK